MKRLSDGRFVALKAVALPEHKKALHKPQVYICGDFVVGNGAEAGTTIALA
jgi:hypothetical protein